MCAPGPGDPGYITAKKHLELLVLYQQVRVVGNEHDENGRLIAEVFAGNTSINEAQRKNGYRC